MLLKVNEWITTFLFNALTPATDRYTSDKPQKRQIKHESLLTRVPPVR